ncbi:hypothetical protein ACVTW2_000659 [Escherichia coli]
MNINKLIADTITYGNRAFNLTQNEIHYLSALLSFAKEISDSPEFWPSRDNIKCRIGGMNKDTQIKAEKKLTEKGLFLGKTRHQIGMKCPNNYFLNLELMQERYSTFETVDLQERQAEEIEQVAVKQIAPITEKPQEAPQQALQASPIPEQPQAEKAAQEAIESVLHDTQICVPTVSQKREAATTEIPVVKAMSDIERYVRSKPGTYSESLLNFYKEAIERSESEKAKYELFLKKEFMND